MTFNVIIVHMTFVGKMIDRSKKGENVNILMQNFEILWKPVKFPNKSFFLLLYTRREG